MIILLHYTHYLFTLIILFSIFVRTFRIRHIYRIFHIVQLSLSIYIYPYSQIYILHNINKWLSKKCTTSFIIEYIKEYMNSHIFLLISPQMLHYVDRIYFRTYQSISMTQFCKNSIKDWGHSRNKRTVKDALSDRRYSENFMFFFKDVQFPIKRQTF